MITAKKIRKALRYYPTTGHFTWRVSRGNQAKKGMRAGWTNNIGYAMLSLYGEQFLAHRVAWLYVTGKWPKFEIDHKNLNRSDNRWVNLRPANRSQNVANAPIRRQNSSGLKGAYWWEARKVWKSCVCISGRNKHLGYYATKEEAHAAYVAAAKKQFGEFARAA